MSTNTTTTALIAEKCHHGLHVPGQTVAGYLQILEDTLQATTVGAFEAGLRIRERRHPKFYLVDPGLARAVKRQLGPVTAEERGPLIEGLVLMLLRFYRERTNLCEDIGDWAPTEAQSTEVDFVLTRKRDRIAIEVKATRTLRPTDVRGLRAIGDLAGLRRRILVYLGQQPLATPDGIEAWPFAHLARVLAEETLWP